MNRMKMDLIVDEHFGTGMAFDWDDTRDRTYERIHVYDLDAHCVGIVSYDEDDVLSLYDFRQALTTADLNQHDVVTNDDRVWCLREVARNMWGSAEGEHIDHDECYASYARADEHALFDWLPRGLIEWQGDEYYVFNARKQNRSPHTTKNNGDGSFFMYRVPT